VKLKDYLEMMGIGHYEFARKIKITPKTLWRINNGEDMKMTTAVRISRETNGAVKLEDLADGINDASQRLKGQSKIGKK
jgi:predicted transcriptional regulator